MLILTLIPLFALIFTSHGAMNYDLTCPAGDAYNYGDNPLCAEQDTQLTEGDGCTTINNAIGRCTLVTNDNILVCCECTVDTTAMCTLDFTPVCCTSDQITYSNECSARNSCCFDVTDGPCTQEETGDTDCEQEFQDCLSQCPTEGSSNSQDTTISSQNTSDSGNDESQSSDNDNESGEGSSKGNGKGGSGKGSAKGSGKGSAKGSGKGKGNGKGGSGKGKGGNTSGDDSSTGKGGNGKGKGGNTSGDDTSTGNGKGGTGKGGNGKGGTGKGGNGKGNGKGGGDRRLLRKGGSQSSSTTESCRKQCHTQRIECSNDGDNESTTSDGKNESSSHHGDRSDGDDITDPNNDPNQLGKGSSANIDDNSQDEIIDDNTNDDDNDGIINIVVGEVDDDTDNTNLDATTSKNDASESDGVYAGDSKVLSWFIIPLVILIGVLVIIGISVFTYKKCANEDKDIVGNLPTFKTTDGKKRTRLPSFSVETSALTGETDIV